MAKARAIRRRASIVVRRTRDTMTRDERGLISVVVGGLAGFLMNTDMVKKSEWLQKNWYALPIALLLVGYALAKRRNPHGKTLMALGGYLFVNGFQNQPPEAQKPPEKKSFTPGEAGSPWWNWQPSEAQWVVTPDGQRVLMPASQYHRAYQDAAAPALAQAKYAGNDAVNRVVDEIYDR